MGYKHQWTDIQNWIGKSSKLFIKKLSRNDCVWADGAKNGHQNGIYIPREIRDANFFPALKQRKDKEHIYDRLFQTFWPATGEEMQSSLKHYSNKGSEMHFTRVPKKEFADLTPASLLIGGHLQEAVGTAHYWFVILDSSSDEAELLEARFGLSSDFHFGVFDTIADADASAIEIDKLIEELSAALNSGSLQKFIAYASKLPASEVLAADAQQIFLDKHRLRSLDPYVIPAPGDAIMRISRDIEYTLFKRVELRRRTAEVINIISKNTDLVSSVVRGFRELDAIFLSASQQRKSRAGQSFELHIGRMLRDGHIAHEEQKVISSRRPDFILPTLVMLKLKKRSYDDAAILSAKTTLRERWKQLALEKFNSAIFLATVDDRVSEDAINDMSAQKIHLVVPESLKWSSETCYSKKANVITFRDFFDDEIAKKRPKLRIINNPRLI